MNRGLALLVALLLASSAPIRAKPVPLSVSSLISRASALVDAQQNQDALTVRSLDRQLAALGSEAAALDYSSAEPLARAAADPKLRLKLRVWLASYLEGLRDPAAFSPLKRLLLDASQPDLLRSAAARGLAFCAVAPQARRQALCAALETDLGEHALRETLLQASSLGCPREGALERRAKAYGKRPAGREAALAGLATAALGESPTLEATAALERLLAHFAVGSEARGAVLQALARRAPELRLAPDAWLNRATAALFEESPRPANASRAVKLLAALGDPRAAAALQRLLRNADGGVAVDAAEALGQLGARPAAPALVELYEHFHQDPRFAPEPGRDAVALYERLGAALKRLQ